MAALHLELSLGSRRSTVAGVPFGDRFIDGCQKLGGTLPNKLLGIEGYTELNRSQFVRLSQELGESISDWNGRQIQVLKDLCLVANCSEEFFLSVSKDQWLRTAIICDKDSPKALLFSDEVKVKDLDLSCRNALSSDHAVSITIHSKVVPYWPPTLQTMRDEAPEDASKRLYFPSMFLDSALADDRLSVEKLNEWEKSDEQRHERVDDEECDHLDRAARPFWNIESGDVEVVKSKFEGGSQADVGKIIWRGGVFARKVFKCKESFETELEVVRRVSHPHIVYSFGVSIYINEKQEKQHSLLMELLDGDLFLLIKDRVRLEGRSVPPFSRSDSIHILLQVAKAMAFVHDLDEPVIHGDLKPQNILVSQCGILGDVCQYFVKVADFGSARIIKPSSTFKPDGGTTKYAAPEVLKARSDKDLTISCPQKIDVYSFGILAFQVLTGLEPYKRCPNVFVKTEGGTGFEPYEGVPSPSVFKKGVITGTMRPPLREACSSLHFWSDRGDLISFIESCWHPEPSARPHFSVVADRLESIYHDLIQKQINGSNSYPLPETNAVDDAVDEMIMDFDAPQTNAVDDPQICPQSFSSRLKRKGQHLLRFPCISPRKTID
ncbi:hypothetical protein KC19_12G040300 [Ceratodon purpureus]|uniref:Protein kinase domain-containing protein n=1 Tax=Ceratodon purpureus TaxID=3225 RepID=A0A8T0G956_CERPU|nr:hypothetical protein KC19_12G040300 [Ceratodon purpureus]